MTTFSQPLSSLFAKFPFPHAGDFGADPLISGICLDSRKAQPGDLFVALRGGAADGHRFIGAALERGAVAVVGEDALSGLGVPYLRVENSRRALSHLAAALYHFPGNHLTVIGVTGTDGKTTTSSLIHAMLLAAGQKAGLISTVNAVIGDETLDTGFHVTTPDAPDVQRYLARMAAAGLTHAVLETTSHGLAQFRADAAEFDLAVFTNVTHEHLDEHGSYAAYLAAKARLLELTAQSAPKDHAPRRLAVLNRDDASFEALAALAREKNLPMACYSLEREADLRAEAIELSPAGMRFRVRGPGFRLMAQTRLLGRYNVSNCLAALTAAIFGLGLHPQMAARGLENLPGVPGRMEAIDLGQDFSAIVDFAHTPNALKVTLQTARALLQTRAVPGRVIVAFGSAGLRVREKRRMMAETAAELADFSILTAEDPRTESLDAILAEMAAGAQAKGGLEDQTFFRVPDRGEAIRRAIRLARPGDIVLACSKGHEQSMCFGSVEYAWDDRTAMRAALSELLGLPGPQMPYLPTQEKAA
ncbi:MAG: UDP-N-acetylmuramoyl-L-alanyl-D-glutamate--2,6-diaminopimelate ligase [Anaerolineales bacterium]